MSGKDPFLSDKIDEELYELLKQFVLMGNGYGQWHIKKELRARGLEVPA